VRVVDDLVHLFVRGIVPLLALTLQAVQKLDGVVELRHCETPIFQSPPRYASLHLVILLLDSFLSSTLCRQAVENTTLPLHASELSYVFFVVGCLVVRHRGRGGGGGGGGGVRAAAVAVVVAGGVRAAAVAVAGAAAGAKINPSRVEVYRCVPTVNL
jgi:hypothetical protein